MSGNNTWFVEAETCPLPEFPCCQRGVWLSARGPEIVKRCEHCIALVDLPEGLAVDCGSQSPWKRGNATRLPSAPSQCKPSGDAP
jgi:hypothetical protein